MPQLLVIISVAAGVALVAYTFRNVLIGLKRIRNQKTTPQSKGKQQEQGSQQIITCRSCHAKLRVPVNRGNLMVHCLKCGTEFIHDSGPKPWSPASAYKPPKKATPPKAPKTPKAPLDELANYRPGGALRQQINTSPSNTREALLNLIATWTAASLRTYLYDHTSALWENVRGCGGRIESASLELGVDQLKLNFRFANAPAPGYTFQYTYNEITESEGDAPIRLSLNEIEWVRCATLSRLADTVPLARMENGCLIP